MRLLRVANTPAVRAQAHRGSSWLTCACPTHPTLSLACAHLKVRDQEDALQLQLADTHLTHCFVFSPI